MLKPEINDDPFIERENLQRKLRDWDKKAAWAWLLQAGLFQPGRASQNYWLLSLLTWTNSVPPPPTLINLVNSCITLYLLKYQKQKNPKKPSPHKKITFSRSIIFRITEYFFFIFFSLEHVDVSVYCVSSFMPDKGYLKTLITFIIIYFSHFRFSFLQNHWCTHWCGTLAMQSSQEC